MPATDELDALLRACKADPTDDAVRRVLADFLEEQGDGERAELIRLQLDLPDEERGDWTPTAAEGEARIIRLIRKNAAAWLGGTYSSHAWSDVPGAEEGETASVKWERGLARVQVGEDPRRELPLDLP